LRTPLAAIVASAGSLRRSGAAHGPDEREHLATAIEDEAARLDRVVGNLLDLSRIETGSVSPHPDWHDLGALIEDTGRTVPGLRFVTDVPDDLPPVLLDYVEIQQVLRNLLENAVRHAGSTTLVEIEVTAGTEEIAITVSDNGPGLPGGELERLFDPFYQGGGARRREGSGLGLAVARGFVEAHGGRIEAANRPEGGACFTVTLPREALPQAAAV
jgi:two-component system sensor histidine kinase KdpD